MGTRLPSPKKGAQSPQFLAHVSCVKRLDGLRCHLLRMYCLGPGHIVLDGDPAPRPKKGKGTIFAPCLLWPNGWMDQDATWYGCRPRPRPRCVRWGLSSPTERSTAAPTFRPMSIVTKRSPISIMQFITWYMLYPRNDIFTSAKEDM